MDIFSGPVKEPESLTGSLTSWSGFKALYECSGPPAAWH